MDIVYMLVGWDMLVDFVAVNVGNLYVVFFVDDV